MSTILVLMVITFANSYGQSNIAKWYLGYRPKNIKKMSPQKILSITEASNLDFSSIGYLDSNYVINIFKTIKDENSASSYMQPLQLLVFDKNGKILSHTLNCDGEFIKLGRSMTWRESMVTIPTKDSLHLDSNINLSFINKHFVILKEKHTVVNYDYLIYIIWSDMMPRHRQTFFEEVHKLITKYPELKIKLLALNYDYGIKSYVN